MKSDSRAGQSLGDLEMEVEAEGREWMRRRLEQKLQAQAQQDGAIFPPGQTESAPSKEGNDAIAHQHRSGGAEGEARKKSR